MRGKLDRVNFRKDFRDSYYRCVISNNPRNNCGTYFGSSSLLASKVAKKMTSAYSPRPSGYSLLRLQYFFHITLCPDTLKELFGYFPG